MPEITRACAIFLKEGTLPPETQPRIHLAVLRTLFTILSTMT